MPFFKLQRPREFKIETYYYQPKDDDYDPKRRIRFRRIRHYKRPPKANPLHLLIIALLLLFFLFYFQKKTGLGRHESEPEKIQVEEIIIVDD